MTLKTLFLGISIDKKDVEQYTNPTNAKSLFDYDIVVIDPDVVLLDYKSKIPLDVFIRYDWKVHGVIKKLNDKLKKEISLLLKKGGLLVSLLKPVKGFTYEYRGNYGTRSAYVTNYDWAPINKFDPKWQIESGRGSRIKLSSEAHDFYQYLRMDNIYWLAYFDNLEHIEEDSNCLAVNDANKCISLEVNINKGSIIFLPFLEHTNTSHIILQCATKYFTRKKLKYRPEPDWVKAYKLVNEDKTLKEITDISNKIDQLKYDRKKIQERLNNIRYIKKLLYEGNDQLEEIVKLAFIELGFKLDKKDDIDWIISSDDQKAILEITGSESTIDVIKFRQLLNYLLTDLEKTGEEKKAILVGNHFMNDPPNKRGPPFTQKAIEEAKIHSICLLSTVELFELICGFRKGLIDQKNIWQSLINTIGLYKST